MAKSWLPWLLAAAVIVMVTVPERADAFSASFSWAGITACEKTSPEFKLDGVPAGTKRLRFEMHDLDVPAFYHGGSTIVFDGAGAKRGAINYIGPCPPGGQHHRYRWNIEALDGAGKVLATTSVTRTFPP